MGRTDTEGEFLVLETFLTCTFKCLLLSLRRCDSHCYRQTALSPQGVTLQLELIASSQTQCYSDYDN